MGGVGINFLSEFEQSVSGIGDVFDPDNLEDHVMHGGARINQDYSLKEYDINTDGKPDVILGYPYFGFGNL